MTKRDGHRRNAHVLARGGDALQKFEVVVRLDATLINPLTQHVERRQVAGVGRVQNRYHHLEKGRYSVSTAEEAKQFQMFSEGLLTTFELWSR